jgi:hypothetical protein
MLSLWRNLTSNFSAAKDSEAEDNKGDDKLQTSIGLALVKRQKMSFTGKGEEPVFVMPAVYA